MPYGGGAIGGGGGGLGGGGGGFSGGVTHGGWLTTHIVTSGAGGGTRGGRGARGPGVIILTVSLLLAFVIFFVILTTGTVLGLRARRTSDDVVNNNIATDFYSPGDSRLLLFSSFFCESLSLDVDSAGIGASLTVVNSTPPLTTRNSFNISVQRSPSPRNYHFWQYYLYPGSNISINACTLEGSATLDVYVVKGNSNANEWGRSPSSQHVELVQSVGDRCPQDTFITYTASEEDEYYVFFFNQFQIYAVYYSATLQFERFEYALPTTNTSIDSCSAASGEQCTVGVPYGTGSQQVLVTTTIPENVDWEENVDINIKCNSRHWAYAIVIIFPLIVVLATVVCLSMCIVLYCKHKRQPRASPLIDNIDYVT